MICYLGMVMQPQWLGVSRDQWCGAILAFGSIFAGLGVIFKTGVQIANAMAFLGSSGVMGFIFGIPRVHSSDAHRTLRIQHKRMPPCE